FHATTASDNKKLDQVHQENAQAAREALSKRMRPELINRFDAIVTFRALTLKEVGKIFDNLIDELQERLVPKGIRLDVKPSAKRYLIKKGYDEKYGARPLRRAIQDELEHRLADGILAEEYEKGSILSVTAIGGKLAISISVEQPA
ncbi:ATP-dependent Clp protease ATP-binding subunit, partial [Candidatus Saccharibacteria bacterium]|nr:ATP-dependent Clp protease ATP-binding subunit [Candidatus Saccharibacteria bacterium]